MCYLSSQLMGLQEYRGIMMELIEPNLSLDNTSISDQKVVCLVLELRKYRGMSMIGINSEFLGLGRMHWDYDHLVWVSEFVSEQACPSY